MNKEAIKKMLLTRIAKKNTIAERAKVSEDVEELRRLTSELDSLNAEIAEIEEALRGIEEERKKEGAEAEEKGKKEEAETEFRSGKPITVAGDKGLEILSSYGANNEETQKREASQKDLEKRGKDLKEGRSVTLNSNVVVPKFYANDIRPTFNEVSTLLDRVTVKPLKGGETFVQPYIVGYGVGGYTDEGANYHGAAGEHVGGEADVTFAYATMNKTKVTAYAEESEEIIKLPDADYSRHVDDGVVKAVRKKVTSQILTGDGDAGHLVGIFSNNANAIDADTDIALNKITNTTLDEIIYSYGGDEDVEDAAVLILNKKDLKAFARLRSHDGKKLHTIVSHGNTGTIDGIPFLINSACGVVSADNTANNTYCMAYGSLSNYMLVVFSDLDVSRSLEHKFKQGMIAFKANGFYGGNVVSRNGFIRVKKSSTPVEDYDTSLKALKIGSDSVTDFDAEDFTYHEEVTTASNKITATPTEPDAQVEVFANGEAVAAGNSISWGTANDVTVVTVVVTLGDSYSVYTIVVTKTA